MPLEFVDEPPAQTRESAFGHPPKYMEEAAELRRHPGQWAVIEKSASQAVASQMRRGAYAAFKTIEGAPQEWEIVHRANPINEIVGDKVVKRFSIYVRYIGLTTVLPTPENLDLIPEYDERPDEQAEVDDTPF